MRVIYFLQLILISLLLGTGFYLEATTGLIPCPLCILQRVVFGLLGIWFLLGAVFGHRRLFRLIVNVCIALSASLGILLAGRQVYLQHVANPNQAECGASLQYMLQVLPLQEVAQHVLSGGTECAKRNWIFLSLDMAEWALLFFAAFFLFAIYLFCKDLCAKR
jgi:disulfide bond formation protein DsbB